jgi:hypothetical protein
MISRRLILSSSYNFGILRVKSLYLSLMYLATFSSKSAVLRAFSFMKFLNCLAVCFYHFDRILLLLTIYSVWFLLVFGLVLAYMELASSKADSFPIIECLGTYIKLLFLLLAVWFMNFTLTEYLSTGFDFVFYVRCLYNIVFN